MKTKASKSLLLLEAEEEIAHLEGLLSVARKRKQKIKTAIHLSKQERVNSVLLTEDEEEVKAKRQTYAEKLATFTLR